MRSCIPIVTGSPVSRRVTPESRGAPAGILLRGEQCTVLTSAMRPSCARAQSWTIKSPKSMGSRGATLPLRGRGAAPLVGFRGKSPKRPSGRKYLKLQMVKKPPFPEHPERGFIMPRAFPSFSCCTETALVCNPPGRLRSSSGCPSTPDQQHRSRCNAVTGRAPCSRRNRP